MNKNFNFSSLFKKANLLSILIFAFSILCIFFKGLNYGIDFKGGTLIELRVIDNNVTTSDIRSSFKELVVGDVSVKEFGKKNDYLIKIELTNEQDKNFVEKLKNNIGQKLSSEIVFRRVENVGRK